MSATGDFLTIVKKIFLVSEELTRLSAEVKDLTHKVHEHDGRLIRIETTLAISARSSRLILPGG
jgi:hypothetical protein